LSDFGEGVLEGMKRRYSSGVFGYDQWIKTWFYRKEYHKISGQSYTEKWKYKISKM